MMRWLILLFFGFFLSCNSHAQGKDSLYPDPDSIIQITKLLQAGPHPASPNFRNRKRVVGGITAAGFAGSFVLLNTVWYQQYQRTGFHTFNDAGEWLQVDKLGHAWSTYHLTHLSVAAWRWAGLRHEKAMLAGSITAMSYVTIIEVLDAYSAKWGWSWADAGANVFGISLYALQQLQWREQRVQYKFSAHFRNYPADLQRRTDELFGHTAVEKLFKDYNAQAYWLSANLRSFFPQSRLPAWLNLAVGYGAEGMYGGFDNIGFDHEGNRNFYRPDIRRYRQWMLAPDLDLTRIRTNSKTLRTVFSIFNNIKFPAPALEFSRGRLRGRLLQF